MGVRRTVEPRSIKAATVLIVIQDPNRSNTMNDSQPKTKDYKEIRLMNRSTDLNDSYQESSTYKTEWPFGVQIVHCI
jgi:hypothetical protein